MPTARNTAGSRTVDRLTSRMDRETRGDLREESVAGGGKVIRGELATRALEVLGARAMTLDRSIIVSDDFDMQSVEDQALFAHEQYHAMYGDGDGGGGGSNYRDAEEIAARAVERLALSRAAKGGFESGGGGATRGLGGHGHSHVSGDSAGGGTSSGPSDQEEDESNGAPSAERGYRSLLSQGYSHHEIVDFLMQKALEAADKGEAMHRARFGDIKGTL